MTVQKIPKKTDFEIWYESFNPKTTEIWRLENKNNIELYKENEYYWADHFRWSYDPMYFIWDRHKDKMIYAGLDYNQAYKIWLLRVKEKGN